MKPTDFIISENLKFAIHKGIRLIEPNSLCVSMIKRLSMFVTIRLITYISIRSIFKNYFFIVLPVRFTDVLTTEEFWKQVHDQQKTYQQITLKIVSRIVQMNKIRSSQ